MSKKLDERLDQLRKAEQRLDNMNRISTPKIQRLPVMLRHNDRFVKYCTPKMISFGPIHHGSEILKKGEHYKLVWTSKFLAKYNEHQDSNEATQCLLGKIKKSMKELKEEFDDDVILEKKYDEELAWMLFVDGCSLLHFMENVDDNCPETLNLKFDQLLYIWRDTLLLENQLPRRLLEMLSKKEGPKLEYLFSNHLDFGEYKRNGTINVFVQNLKPVHLLDYHRSACMLPRKLVNIDTYEQMEINTISNQEEEHITIQIDHQQKKTKWLTYKNVRDLKRVGIRVIPISSSKNSFLWDDINFTCKWWFIGELRLPIFYYNDVTTIFFGNIIAYEMCPDVQCKYEFCSYISYMDSLVDSAEDVKELRLSGVVQNMLPSDEDLANFFNELGHDLPTKMYSGFSRTDSLAFNKKYIFIKQQIEKHYTTNWRTWLAEAYNTYFSTPWAIIAFFAASLVLILTFIQTLYTIHS